MAGTGSEIMRYETEIDNLNECVTLKDNNHELKSDFESDIVLYPIDDALSVVQKLNWYELLVEMMKEHLTYEGWTEDDFKGLIEDVEANLDD